MADVFQFPLDRFGESLKRHLNAVYAEMAAKGYTQQQMQELTLQTIKEIGLVETNGVWHMPGELSPNGPSSHE